MLLQEIVMHVVTEKKKTSPENSGFAARMEGAVDPFPATFAYEDGK